MPAHPEPSDGDLVGFLLGALPVDRAEVVRAWLDADSARAERLARVPARDALTDAAAEANSDDPVPDDAVERVVRRVADALSTPREGSGDTPEHSGPGATVTYVPARADDPAPAWPPARLGEYRVVRELGRGGMGVVFELADEKLGRRVAAKVLAPDLARRPDAAERFLREARAAAAVEHDHVVPILHVGEDAGAAYLVMPLLKGESLADRLKRGALPGADVVRVGRDVASALGAAHARGLVHRDVKPANVWLDADTGRARVLDFGLARAGGDGGDAAELGAVMGTPAYMAPEQADGRPATARSDLFALGAVLYECATGRRPFEAPTVTAILAAVREHDPPSPAQVNPAIPATLSALIDRLLAKDPTRRPADAAEVLTALAAAAVGDVTTKWEVQPARPDRGRRGAWIAGGVVLAALLAAAGWLGTRPRGGSEAPRDPPAPIRYRGKIDVLIERTIGGSPRLLRLNEPDALPLRATDKFRVEGEVDSPAYLYVVWVDPGRDVTPVYPWDAAKGWGSRPATEQPEGRVSLPPNAGERYTAPKAQPGVATVVLFARRAPLDVPDDVVKGWFEALPDLPLPPGGSAAAVWFDEYTEARDPGRLRTFGVVGADDAFARWQGQLQKALGEKAAYQTAVSFARTGGK